MKTNKEIIKYHLEVVFLSIFYPDILNYINELDVVNNITYTYSATNFLIRFVLSLLIGLALGVFAYKSKEILKYKSVRVHIIVWIVIFTLLTIFTPLAWLKIVEIPQVLIDIMFNLKLIYLGEQLIILGGFYTCLLGYYYLNKKVNQ